MLIEFYGLSEQPFGMTPNPRFLFLSSMHREAIASLTYGIESDRGFLALIAAPGMGKTTVLYHLLEHFRSTAKTAFIFQTQCDSQSLLRQLMHEFGLNAAIRDPVEISENLKQLLLCEAEANRRVVLILDEAQNLDNTVLETVRLLSNFETRKNKLLHIILSGQPALGETLAAPELLQLRQRVSMVVRLEPFSRAETEAYISHRLKVAGLNGNPFFTRTACARIAEFSHGIPRNINNLCFNALSMGYAMGRPLITADIIEEVCRDLDLSAHFGIGTQSALHATVALSRTVAPVIADNRPATRKISSPLTVTSGTAAAAVASREKPRSFLVRPFLAGLRSAICSASFSTSRTAVAVHAVTALAATAFLVGTPGSVLHRNSGPVGDRVSLPQSPVATVTPITETIDLESHPQTAVAARTETNEVAHAKRLPRRSSNSTSHNNSDASPDNENSERATHTNQDVIPPPVNTSDLRETKNEHLESLAVSFAPPVISARWPTARRANTDHH
jgi:general secretion pathway protein A